MRRRLGFMALAACIAIDAEAATSGLDETFGENGFARFAQTGGSLSVSRPVVDASGRILICRSGLSSDGVQAAAYVERMTRDGEIDSAFGDDGRAAFDSSVDASCGLVVQHDGHIVVFSSRGSVSAGVPELDTVLVRFDDDGHRDPEFGDGGAATIDFESADNENISAIALAADDAIVVGVPLSRNRFGVARVTRDGAVDATFGTGGQAIAEFPPTTLAFDSIRDVLIDDAGRISLAGSISTDPVGRELFAVARFLDDGAVDTSFGNDGKVTLEISDRTATCHAALLAGEGRLLLIGNIATSWPPNTDVASVDIGVARLLEGGTIDASFGDGGVSVIPVDLVVNGYDVALDGVPASDGGAFLVGDASTATQSDGLVLKLDRNGRRDALFGANGALTFDAIPGEAASMTLIGVARQGAKLIVTGTLRGGSAFALRISGGNTSRGHSRHRRPAGLLRDAAESLR
ncbi:MAG: hypothetical protein ABW186_14875 [Rhodanobacteraceae bacterium]